MLVIHPKDRTTLMLQLLYKAWEVQLIDQSFSKKEICHVLNHTSVYDRIMLLGHGSDKGLFSRDNDEEEVFNRLIVSHSHARYLRKHGGNLIGMWCNADLFAESEGLHGLFTGMIISELNEALVYDVETTQEELNRENIKLTQRLRSLLDENIPLSEIPQRILILDDVHTPLTKFNYKKFRYL